MTKKAKDLEIDIDITLWGTNENKFDLYLNPETLVIYTHEAGSTPMSAHHGLHMGIGCQVTGNMLVEPLKDFLQCYSDKILAIAGCYQGAEWDGSNHKGKWNREAVEELLLEFTRCMEHELVHYAEQYFAQEDSADDE